MPSAIWLRAELATHRNRTWRGASLRSSSASAVPARRGHALAFPVAAREAAGAVLHPRELRALAREEAVAEPERDGRRAR